MVRLPEGYRRLWICLIAAAWASLTWVFASYTEGRHAIWNPSYVAIVFAVASATTFGFAWKPCKHWLFLLSGAFGVMAVFTRAVAIVYYAWLTHNDFMQTLVGQICLSGMLCTLLWWFWQRELRPWHAYHQERCRLDPGRC